MSTIFRVAEVAGVSPATVSRVINRRGGVKSQTVQRVERALEEVQFRPRWKAAPAKAIGIVIFPHPECLAHPYNAHLLSAACETLFAEEYVVQLIPCQRSQEAVSGISKLMATHQIEGVLVLPFHPLGGIGTQLDCAGIPHVAVGPVAPGFAGHHVGTDDFGAGSAAVRYLWGLGHRRFGAVTASTRDTGHQQRLEGIRQALREYTDDPAVLDHREYQDVTAAYGESAAMEWLGNRPSPGHGNSPSAILITNSVLAFGFSRGCHKLGVGVPHDVSLLGFEDAEELATLDPPMTAMRQPTRRVGEQAAQALLAQLRGESIPMPAVFPMVLMVRESTRQNKPAATRLRRRTALSEPKGPTT